MRCRSGHTAMSSLSLKRVYTFVLSGRLAVVSFLIVTTCHRAPTPGEATRERLEDLRNAFAYYEGKNGYLPASLETLCDLRDACVLIDEESGFVDEWNRDIVYRIESASEFTLTSWGADGVAGNADDLGYSSAADRRVARPWYGCYVFEDGGPPLLRLVKLDSARSPQGGFEVTGPHEIPGLIIDASPQRWIAHWSPAPTTDSIEIVFQTLHESVSIRLGPLDQFDSVSGRRTFTRRGSWGVKRRSSRVRGLRFFCDSLPPI